MLEWQWRVLMFYFLPSQSMFLGISSSASGTYSFVLAYHTTVSLLCIFNTFPWHPSSEHPQDVEFPSNSEGEEWERWESVVGTTTEGTKMGRVKEVRSSCG